MNISNESRVEEADKHLRKIHEIMSKRNSVFDEKTKDEVIEEIRKTREKLWEEKIGSCT